MSWRTPSYNGRKPSSERASRAARGASKKTDTKCEILLRSALFRAGYRFRKNVKQLPGRPDVVFTKLKVAVFCDGDFWHGRDWRKRRRKLERGANPDYWIAKIERNMQRDRENTRALEQEGWVVLRLWEREILKSPDDAAKRVTEALREAAVHWG